MNSTTSQMIMDAWIKADHSAKLAANALHSTDAHYCAERLRQAADAACLAEMLCRDAAEACDADATENER